MITSISNHQVKEIVQLQKKSKARNQAVVFIVEGIHMVQEMPAERLEKIYVTEGFYKKYKELLPKGCKPELVSDVVFSYMSDTKTPQGVLAVVRQMKYTTEQILKVENPHIMVLDNLQDPGNLGTIFRTAEAAGVNGLILSKDCVDIYNPKTIRSTMGAIYRMPFVYVEDILETIKNMKKKGICVYAAHLEGKNSYDKEDYTKGTAFLIGNEGNGLRDEVAAQADLWVQIPMAGQVESLNAAIAAAVLMFEAARQRRS